MSHQLLSGFLINGHLSRVSRSLSVNDKGDNDMVSEVVQRFSDIYLTAENCCGKPQLGDHFDQGCATSHRPKWDPLPPNDVGRTAQDVRKDERKEKTKRCVYPSLFV